ncbi:MAG: hypothetical protein H6933_15080 [Burkholderiaceae bacterium]|nr:hypothetical protein [Rhodoferax sp.]MCP5286210.1 hypothetical protein [Burkholderiaceae bacterium]
MSPAPNANPACVAEIRQRVYQVEAEGRQDEARALLARSLRELGRPDPELLADLAAMALRDGDLVPAIRGARLALDARPEDAEAEGEALDAALDSAQFTLGLALAVIGSKSEARQRLHALTEGARGVRFRARTPELATLVQTQLDRLGEAAPTQPTASADRDAIELLQTLARTMRLARTLQVGAVSNALAEALLGAMVDDADAAVYALVAEGDHRLTPVGPAHHLLPASTTGLQAADFAAAPFDLVCLDVGPASDAETMAGLLAHLQRLDLVTDHTLVAVCPERVAGAGPSQYPQDAATELVRLLRARLGYDALCIQAAPRRANRGDGGDAGQIAAAPAGVTLLRRFRSPGA